MSVTVPVNPRVLRWARESVGVGRQEAADRLSVEAVLIEAWEEGDEQPTFGALRELSTFYRRPMAAFLLTDLPKDPPAPADFRAAKNGSRYLLTPATRHALNRAFERREVAAELERAEHDRRATGRPVLDDERTPPAVAASEIRAKLGITIDEQRAWKNPNRALNAWRRALERQGVLVFAMTMPRNEVRGFSISGAGGPPVIVLNTADTEPGRIFTLFHEYGHVLMGTGGICLPSTAPERLSLEGRELYCNRLAGAVLVPAEILRATPEAIRLGGAEMPTDGAISAVAGTFSVSKQVLWYRLRDLGMISRQRFAAKWPGWLSQKPRKRKISGGPKTPSGCSPPAASASPASSSMPVPTRSSRPTRRSTTLGSTSTISRRSRPKHGGAPLADAGGEGGTPPTYVIDTSALVDGWSNYPHRTFARVWDRLAALAAEGRLTAPDEVRNELNRRDAALRAWASDAGLFRSPDEGFVACWARVVAECPYLVPLGRLYAADTLVVALALQIHEEERAKLFTAPCYVVTHEQRKATSGKLKIPDACDHLGLEHVRFVKIFELEGWEGH